MLDPHVPARHPDGRRRGDEDETPVDNRAVIPHTMQGGDEEHDPEGADAHALEHAQRTGHQVPDLLRENREAEHRGTDGGAGQVELLSAVEHGRGV